MQHWLTNWWRDRRGNAAIEMALILPVLLTILAGITEVGYVFYQASALERGLRAGATFASRAELPLSDASKAATENLVKTASMDGTLSVSASNWNEDGAGLTISVTDKNVGSVTVSVIKLEARVPFSPLSGSLLSMLGLESEFIEVSHEQASIAL
jgi:Flp pilus assembly protein TadG